LIGSGYLESDEFLALIKRLQVRWENDGAGLTRMAAEAAQKRSQQLPATPTRSRQEMTALLSQALLDSLFTEADLLAGGIGDGAKFPRVPLLQALLTLPQESELDAFLQLTLAQMAENGLHDHVGGGFFRYTVDPGWQQPHFEKMLADNALLAKLYYAAARRWGSERWQSVGEQTLDAVLRDFAHPDGGYVASLSALDGQGVEGGYYLWQRQEIEARLPLAERRLFARAWRLQGREGWSGELPLVTMDVQALAEMLRMPLSEAQHWQQQIRTLLWQYRSARVLPRDEKRIAGWNGLLLSALAQGVTQGGARAGDYRRAGEGLRHYLESLWDGEQLWRLRGMDGTGQVAAALEDYAYVAQGLLDWSEAVADRVPRQLAVRLTGEAYYRFFHDGSWYTEGVSAAVLPSRRLLEDGGLPSAGAMVAALGRRFGDSSPLQPRQLTELLFTDPQQLLQQPLDYPSYIVEIEKLARRSSRLSLE
jgi:uncharacterized protein YyaL (SSP411 family)